jgi:hypothetical protein
MRTALIILAALPLLAANGNSESMRGRVFDIDGSKQVPNAIVTVSTASGYVASVVTDRNGEFNFAALPAGEYDFRVTARGFAIYERQLTVADNGGVRELDIRLLVPADKQTVSVSELRKSEPAQAPDREITSHRGYRGY